MVRELSSPYLVELGISWWKVARRSLSFNELLMTPAYSVRKLPIYLRFFWARQTKWIRTDRDQDA
jgi:hypothetical protein